MYFFLYFIPVFINIIALPFSLKYGFQDILLLGTSIRDFCMWMNVLIVPLYLLATNVFFIAQKGKKSFPCILMSIAVIASNALITYIDWGVFTGLFFNPDSETVMVSIYFDTVFPILIMLFGMLIFHIIRKCFIKSK